MEIADAFKATRQRRSNLRVVCFPKISKKMVVDAVHIETVSAGNSLIFGEKQGEIKKRTGFEAVRAKSARRPAAIRGF